MTKSEKLIKEALDEYKKNNPSKNVATYEYDQRNHPEELAMLKQLMIDYAKAFNEWCAKYNWVYFSIKNSWKNYNSGEWLSNDEFFALFEEIAGLFPSNEPRCYGIVDIQTAKMGKNDNS